MSKRVFRILGSQPDTGKEMPTLLIEADSETDAVAIALRAGVLVDRVEVSSAEAAVGRESMVPDFAGARKIATICDFLALITLILGACAIVTSFALVYVDFLKPSGTDAIGMPAYRVQYWFALLACLMWTAIVPVFWWFVSKVLYLLLAIQHNTRPANQVLRDKSGTSSTR